MIEKKIRSKAEKSSSPDGTPKNKNKSKKGKKPNLDRTSSPTQTLFVNGNDAETSFERIEDATSSVRYQICGFIGFYYKRIFRHW